MAKPTVTVDAGGRRVAITNPDKVLFPEAGFTKAHVIDHYVRVSPWLLPHLKDRPVTLKRYPGRRARQALLQQAGQFVGAAPARGPAPAGKHGRVMRVRGATQA